MRYGGSHMPLGDHLEALRKRVAVAIVGLAPIFAAAILYGAPLLGLLLEPVRGQLRAEGLPDQVLASHPAEPFMAYLKVALAVTVTLGAPWIAVQAWRFIAPGLHKHERRFAYALAPLSGALAVLAAGFVYTALLPVSVGFFVRFNAGLATETAPRTVETYPELPTVVSIAGDPEDPAAGTFWFNTDRNELRFAVAGNNDTTRTVGVPATTADRGGVAQLFTIRQTLGLVLTMGLVLVVASQLPVALLLANWAGMLEPTTLTKIRKGACFGCFAAGAICTPGDPWSMMLLAAPLYGLYEFSIVLMRVMTPARIAGGADTEADNAQ